MSVLGCLFGFALAQAPPDADELPALTVEDLISAHERGDLSQEQLDELVDLLETRTALDSQVVEALTSDLPQNARRSHRAVSSGRIRPSRVTAYYRTLVAIRGRSPQSQLLNLQAGDRRTGIALQASGAQDAGWCVRRLTGNLAVGRLQLRAGTIEARWVGGLVIGPAPRFISPDTRFWASVLRPQHARLVGGELAWHSGATGVSALYSRQHDDLLSHRLWGMRVQQALLGTHCESAFMYQELRSNTTGGRYVGGTEGISFWRGTRTTGWRTDFGLTQEAWALQAHAAGQIDRNEAWRIAVWRIPPGFRNPVLYARGESDRERIPYPELDVELSSTSTGESGGEGLLKFGRGSRDTEICLTYWREQPYCDASLRAALRHVRHTATGRLNLAYSVRVRMQGDRRAYHVWLVDCEHRQIVASVSVRWQRGATAPDRRLGGGLAAGLRLPQDAYGQLDISVAYESPDFASPGVDYLTLRVDHELPVSVCGQIGIHVRWRSAYRSYDPSLSLRVATAVQW